MAGLRKNNSQSLQWWRFGELISEKIPELHYDSKSRQLKHREIKSALTHATIWKSFKKTPQVSKTNNTQIKPTNANDLNLSTVQSSNSANPDHSEPQPPSPGPAPSTQEKTPPIATGSQSAELTPTIMLDMASQTYDSKDSMAVQSLRNALKQIDQLENEVKNLKVELRNEQNRIQGFSYF